MREQMQVFGDEEKKIICKINNGHGFARNLINIFESIKNLPKVRLRINKTNMTAELLFECKNFQPTNEEIRYAIGEHENIVEKLIVHLVLLKYLEEKGLVTFFEPAQNNQSLIEFGAGAVNLPSFSMAINNQELINLLAKYINKEIIPTPALRNLEKNKFQSSEELRFIKQQKTTWCAIAATFVIGVAGIAFNIYSDYQVKSFQKKQAAQSFLEINEIITTLNNMSNSIKATDLQLHPALEKIASEISKLSLVPENTPKPSLEQKD